MTEDIVRRIAYANYIEILHGKPQKEIKKINDNINILKTFKIPVDYNEKLYNTKTELLKILKKLQKFHLPSLNEDSIKLEIFKFFNIFHTLSTILQIFNQELANQNKINIDFTKAIQIVKDILNKFTNEYTKYIHCEEGENVGDIESWRNYSDEPSVQQAVEAKKKLEDIEKNPAFVKFFKKLSPKYKKSEENAKQIIEKWNNDINNIARLNRKNLNYLKITEKQITDLMKKIHSTFYVENTSLIYAFIKINKFISEYDKENKYPGLIASLIMKIPLALKGFKNSWFKDYSKEPDEDDSGNLKFKIKPLFVEEETTMENVYDDVSEFLKLTEKSYAFYLEQLFQQDFINEDLQVLFNEKELEEELEKFVKFSSVMESRRASLKVLEDTLTIKNKEIDRLKKKESDTGQKQDTTKFEEERNEIQLLIEKLKKSQAINLCKDENSTCCAAIEADKKEECAAKTYNNCKEPNCKRRYEHDIDSIDRMDIDDINDQEKQKQKQLRSGFNTYRQLSEVEQFLIGQEQIKQGRQPTGESGQGVAETRENEYTNFLKNKKKKATLKNLRKKLNDHIKNVQLRKKNLKDLKNRIRNK